MLADLSAAGAGAVERTADVVVIGAGLAGLVTACELCRCGRRVIVLESGDRTQEAERHPLNRVEQTGQDYDGAEHGRFRCLGGTSTRWGGAMMPFLPEDMAGHTAGWGPGWAARFDELLAFLPRIEEIFSLPPGSYDSTDEAERLGIAGFRLRHAKWPPFRMRNVARALADQVESADGPEIWLNAHAAGLGLGADGRLTTIEALSDAGNRLKVTARQVVLAAGALESTRLLLLLDRRHDERLFAPDGVLGRHLCDHLSAACADLRPLDRAGLNMVAGFSFEGRGMRNPRFVMEAAARRQHRLPASYCHVSFASDQGSGFSALRDILRAAQKRRPPDAATVARMLSDLPWLGRALWWRWARRRLLYPADAQIHVSAAIEQWPAPGNRISLSDDARDRFGQPLARIHWTVDDRDVENFAALSRLFVGMWRASPLASLAEIVPRRRDAWGDQLRNCGGVYHPAGTIRTGRTARDGVVDGAFRAFRIPNLSVVSTATFPTAGSANPTLMMLLSGLLVARNVARV